MDEYDYNKDKSRQLESWFGRWIFIIVAASAGFLILIVKLMGG